MSDTAVSTPTPAAPAPDAGTGEPKPGDPKPSRFRSDAISPGEHLLNKPAPGIAPIKETPPKDPATGKFVPKGGDPNAGVIPELQAREEQPAEQQAEEPPAEVPQVPQELTSSFTPVEIDMGDGRISVFKTKEALENHFKRMAGAQSAEQRRAADLERMVTEMKAKLDPPKDAPPAEPEIRNPFEKSAIDDPAMEGLFVQLYKDVDDPEKGPVVAMSRVIDHLEKRISDLVKFINHERTQATAPMEQFLTAMNDINQTSTFFQQVTQETNQDGSPKYPDVRSRRAITDLTRIMHQFKFELTPSNFGLAYDIWKAKSNPGGAPQPQRAQPPDNSSAASAAAVMSGRAAHVPDPRAEKRTPTFRDEMDAVPLGRGRFRSGI